MHQLFLSRRTHLTEKKKTQFFFPTLHTFTNWLLIFLLLLYHISHLDDSPPLQVLQLSVLTRVPWEEDSAALPFMAATSSSSMTSNRLR